jgi:cytochrome c-type biogenesis protein CcmH/NrfG
MSRLPWLRIRRTLHGEPRDPRAWLMLGAARALEREKHTVRNFVNGVDLGSARSS